MVLTAILTAIHSRLGVFAGVHCRTDSLRVRISGHRRTAADASPVTYKQGVSSSSLLAPTSGVTFPRTRPQISAFSAFWASIRGFVGRNAPHPPECRSAPPFSQEHWYLAG